MNREYRVPSPHDLEHLSSEQRAEIAAVYLEGVHPGRQPFNLFRQLQRISVSSTVEFIPIRTDDSEPTEVLLTQRPSNDPWWPDQWHVPGVVLLPTEETDDQHSYLGPIKRIVKDELAAAIHLNSPPQLLTAHLEHGTRGTESKLIYWAEVTQTCALPPKGTFFDALGILRQPPESGLIEGHAATIERAANAYNTYQNNR